MEIRSTYNRENSARMRYAGYAWLLFVISNGHETPRFVFIAKARRMLPKIPGRLEIELVQIPWAARRIHILIASVRPMARARYKLGSTAIYLGFITPQFTLYRSAKQHDCISHSLVIKNSPAERDDSSTLMLWRIFA